MKTTKPVSTISYNSEEYLKIKLGELTKAKIISFWVYIKHKPDEDEKKEHIHLYVEPAKLLQTDDIKEHFKEPDTQNPEKPLGCISFRTSKFGDWYYYGLHNKAYLSSKGQSRKHHYKPSDMITSDEDDLRYHVSDIEDVKVAPYQDMMKAQNEGLTFGQYAMMSGLPITLMKPYQEAWYMLQSDKTYRANRLKHEDDKQADFEESVENIEIQREEKRKTYNRNKILSTLEKAKKKNDEERQNNGKSAVIQSQSVKSNEKSVLVTPAYAGQNIADIEESEDDELPF